MPYVDPNLNMFQLYSMSTSFVIFYGGLCIYSPDLGVLERQIAGSIIFIDVLVFFLFAAVFLYYIYRSNRRRHLANAERRRVGKAVFDESEDDEPEENLVVVNPVSAIKSPEVTGAYVIGDNGLFVPSGGEMQTGVTGGVVSKSPAPTLSRKNSLNITSPIAFQESRTPLVDSKLSRRKSMNLFNPKNPIMSPFGVPFNLESHSSTNENSNFLKFDFNNRHRTYATMELAQAHSFEQMSMPEVRDSLQVRLVLKGVDAEMLRTDQDRRDFMDELSSNIASTLGYSSTNFVVREILPELSNDSTIVFMDIVSDSPMRPPNLLFEFLDQYIKLSIEYKNPGELIAFIESVSKL